MIDSHCHLDHEPLFKNLNQVLERSKKIGLKKILTISTSLESYKNILKIFFDTSAYRLSILMFTFFNLCLSVK